MKKLYIFLSFIVLASLIGSVNAIPMAWSPYVAIQLSNTTTLQSSQMMFINSFSFGNNSLLLNNVYMGSGNTISALNVSCSNANLTLNKLSSIGETSITTVSDDLYAIYLGGFGRAPASVITIANASVPYFYSSGNDSLALYPDATGTETILIDFPLSTTDVDDAIGLAAVALIFGITMGSVALVFALRRRKNDDEY